jgi:hypothetical protein
MRSLGVPLTVTAALIGVAVYHGLATDRWADPAADVSTAGLPPLPLTIREWTAEILPRHEDDDRRTSVENRRYRHRSSDAWILTSLTAGRAGRVSIHNPENCYLGNGYQVVDSIRVDTIPVGDRETRFWTGHFQKKKPSGIESIRIYWGWTTQSDWLAPEYPRLFFAGKSRLFKLYFIHPVEPSSTHSDAIYREFMVDFLTAWQRAVRSWDHPIGRTSDTAHGREQ